MTCSKFLLNRVLRTGVMVAGLLWTAAVSATPAAGDVFYTLFTGGVNVWRVSYSYDGTTATLGTPTAIVAAPGADGIIFAPSGNLLIGGAGSARVYEYTTGGTLVGSGSAGAPSFHLALDPSGTKVWTSNFGGSLADLPLGPIADAGPLHTVTGSDSGVTQLAFAPSGKVFYVNSFPNGFGNVGVIDLATFVTTSFAIGVESAHGMLYDSFTGLMTLFGAGKVGTFDPTLASPVISESVDLACDFDQGSVDGLGHALVAGCGGITFIDYSVSGDITAPNHVQFFGGFIGIDDVAPLSGLGSITPAPEPASTLLAALGLACLLASSRRRGSTRP